MPYAVCVTAHVIRTNREVRDLQTLNPMDVQVLIKYTVLHDGNALFWSHATGTQRVPGGFDMALHWTESVSMSLHQQQRTQLTPFFNMFNILLTVL